MATPVEPAAPLTRSQAAGALLRRLLLSEHFVLGLSLLYFAVLLPFVPHLARPRNLENLLSNMWPLLAIAIGQTIVLIVGGIDLSQTSIMATVSVVGAMLLTRELDPQRFGENPLWGIILGPDGGPFAGMAGTLPLAVLLMLGTGALIGWMNGTAIVRLRMPPFMVTLVSMMFFSAFAIFLTRSENVVNLPESFGQVAYGGLPFLPWPFIIAALVAAGAHVLLGHTVTGRWMFAIGRSEKTSRVSGVPVNRVLIRAYVFSGVCAAVGALLYSARLEMGRPTLGQNLLLDVVGATVIGGTSLFGGKGKVLWTVYGVLFFTLLANSLNLLNLSFFTINIVKGGVILLAALLDTFRRRLAQTAE